MKLFSCLLAAGLLSALPAMALAQDNAPTTPPMGAEPKQPANAADEHKAEPKTEPKTPATKDESTKGYHGRHDVKGQVTSINKDTGMLSLKTPDGEMQLAFPPSAVTKINKGDEVSVELAIKPMPKTAPKP